MPVQKYQADLLARIYEKNHVMKQLTETGGTRKGEKLEQLALELDRLLYEYIKKLKQSGV